MGAFSKLFSGLDVGAHLAGAGFLADSLKSSLAPYINQYFNKDAQSYEWDKTKKLFLWNALLQNHAQDRTEGLQREAWARDDNAYQRTVQDMRSAGLNPLLLSGTTSSQAASFSSGSSGSAPSAYPTQLDQASMLDSLMSLAQYKLSRDEFDEQKNVNAGNDESRKKADSIAAAEDERAEELHNEQMQQQRIQTQILQAEKSKAESEALDAAYEYSYKKKYGFSTQSSDKVKAAKETAGTIKQGAESLVKPLIEAQKNKTVIPSSNQSNSNLSDFSEWLKVKHESVYKDYKLALADGDTRRINQIRQSFRNEFMNSSKEFRHEKRR